MHTPQELLLDGRVLSTLSRFCRMDAEALSANVVQFKAKDFAHRLRAHMTNGRSGGCPNLSEWSVLGNGVRNMFGSVPGMTFLRGHQARNPIKGTARRQKEPKQSKASVIYAHSISNPFDTELPDPCIVYPSGPADSDQRV